MLVPILREEMQGGMMTEKLKPCPHCGGEAVYEHVTFRNPDQNRCAIVCEGCGAYGGPALGSNRDFVEVKARELWNKRFIAITEEERCLGN